MPEKKTEKTRIRLNYKVDKNNKFKPDITSEAETIDTAIANLKDATTKMKQFAQENGFETE
jgi:hypothetical protein